MSLTISEERPRALAAPIFTGYVPQGMNFDTKAQVDALRLKAIAKEQSIIRDFDNRTYVFHESGRVFRVLNAAGRTALGNFKTVRIAEDVFSGTRVASAYMKYDKYCDQELDNLKLLSGSPGFVKYLAHVDFKNKLRQQMRQMFLEWIAGGTLESHYGRVSQPRQVVKDLLARLVTLEKQQLIFRDLKGSNICLNADNIPIVIDPGCLCQEADVASRREWFSDNACIPPEMADALLKGSKERVCELTTSKVDVWAMGCIIFEMYHGKKSIPWRCGEIPHYVYKEGPLEYPPRLENIVKADPQALLGTKPIPDPVVHQLVAKMLEVDPAKRPLASQLLESYLKETQAGRPRSLSAGSYEVKSPQLTLSSS